MSDKDQITGDVVVRTLCNFQMNEESWEASPSASCRVHHASSSSLLESGWSLLLFVTLISATLPCFAVHSVRILIVWLRRKIFKRDSQSNQVYAVWMKPQHSDLLSSTGGLNTLIPPSFTSLLCWIHCFSGTNNNLLCCRTSFTCTVRHIVFGYTVDYTVDKV